MFPVYSQNPRNAGFDLPSSSMFEEYVSEEVWSALTSRPKLVSLDIFDTVLLRRPISEPRRQWMAAVRIAQRFPDFSCTVRQLYLARRLAQEMAYRANRVGNSGQDVPIREILAHQAALAGLPSQSLEELVAIELDVEEQSLVPNRALVSLVQQARRWGTRVIAVSDTPLAVADLDRLLQRLLQETIFDRIYTSADCDGCKHNGKLFRHVQQVERVDAGEIYHIGDNHHSDGRMASLAGQRAIVRARPWTYHALRVCDGGMFRGTLLVPARRMRPADQQPFADQQRHLQARVLGPLVAQYCLRLWLYLSSAGRADECVALFCARGGIGQRIAFEKFLLRTGLKLEMRRENLLISRVVAARGAVLSQSPAAAEALAYEFRGASLRAAAEALAGQPLSLGADWDHSFQGELFFSLLRKDPAAGALRAILVDQNAQFDEHLDTLVGSARRVLLCDTGLFGSTLSLLQAARPEIRFELLLLARSNYRGADASHFAQTVGLLSEADHYSPKQPSSVVLRYWHLIESLFELAVPSATTFPCAPSLRALSNDLENASFQKMEPFTGASFQAASEYLDQLQPRSFFARIMSDSLESWQRLRSIVITPGKAEIDLWATGPRGRDFGRTETVESITARSDSSLMARVRAVRSSRWKEGAITIHLGWCRTPAQWLLEAGYLARSVKLSMRRGLRPRPAVAAPAPALPVHARPALVVMPGNDQ